MSINVCIFGVSGYTGSTLLKLLNKHKNVNLVGVFGYTSVGKKIQDLFPNLLNLPDIKIGNYKNFDFGKTDLIFSCLPHGQFQKEVFANLNYKKSIIDLSGDFRLEIKSEYEKFYKCKHTNFLQKKKFVYGLTEINRKEISSSKFIANPGCYPTSVLIPLMPLLKAKIKSQAHIVVDSKSGVSGAGKILNEQNLFSELSNNFFSYGIDNHKHYPEILQEIRKENSNVSLTFIPHLLPILSGIQSNIYFDSQLINAEEAFDTLKNFYQNEIFVKIFKNKIPKISEVQNTNYVKIGVFSDISKRKTIIISTIDNLVKGAAGQAIQNMNLMFGFNESESLV